VRSFGITLVLRSVVNNQCFVDAAFRDRKRDIPAAAVRRRGKGLFQPGKMSPTPNATIAARPRRACAASHVRCRNIHNVSAIRLPPGRMSTIAEWNPSSRIERARRALHLVLRAVTASSWVRLPGRPPGQLECPNWRSSRASEMSPRSPQVRPTVARSEMTIPCTSREPPAGRGHRAAPPCRVMPVQRRVHLASIDSSSSTRARALQSI
jgi:hypothetical protein